MRNIALQLMYNGTAYHGWQVQKTEVTVAETLEKALATICCHPVKVTGCGRTDAGVHAEHYIANFRTASTIPADRIPLAVNTRLPEDIVVCRAFDVAEDFNAIGSCLRKEYTYRIFNSRIRNPFYVNRAYFYPKRLDEAVMGGAQRGHGDQDHGADHLLLLCHPQRGPSGAEGLCQRVSLQHGAGHHRHCALRRGGEADARGHPGDPSQRQPDPGGAHCSAGGTVSDKTMVRG